MILSLDCEYSEKNVRKADLLSSSIGLQHSTKQFKPNQLRELKQYTDKAKVIYVQNGVVDWFVLHRHGLTLDKSKFLDIMLMEHLIDERLEHSLGDMARRHFNDNYKSEFWGKYSRFQDAPEDEALEYEQKDVRYTFDIGVKYTEALASRWALVEHTHRLQWALFETEVTGIRVNRELIVNTRDTMKAQIDEYLPKLRSEFKDYVTIWELDKWRNEIDKRKSDTGKANCFRPTFSFASNPQLSWLVFEALGVAPIEKTKKGNPSTSYESLRNLSEEYPELRSIADYKETKAVYATFVEGMLERVEDDSRIYPGFFINGTATGRISHNNPNMGNLPTSGIIRNFFIPDLGNVIIGADYSQLEVVIEANLTGDQSLLKIINEGASKHDITAEGLRLPRDQAKTLNFALQYGAGVHKICKLLGVSNKTGQEIFEAYWRLYSGVKNLKDQTSKTLESTGQVTNIFGRVRHFDKPNNEYEKAKQERQAYNFLIQGPGGDMTNMAAYHIQETLQSKNMGRLWFTVHDEVVAECLTELTESAIAVIVHCMDIPNKYLNLKYPVPCKTYGPMEAWGKG